VDSFGHGIDLLRSVSSSGRCWRGPGALG